MCWGTVLGLLLLAQTAFGFATPAIPSSAGVMSTTRLDAASFPRDVKEAVSRCRASVQAALQQRISRMDIEMPVGTNFGVEKKKGKKAKRAGQDDGGPTRDQLETSDRELARLFVEMFQPLGGEHISVVFNEASQAERAKISWRGDQSAKSKVLSMGRRKGGQTSKAKKKTKGFAAKLAAELGDDTTSSGPFKLPDQTEVALFVAPGPKELVIVEKICDEVGMATLVVLLNARLSALQSFGTERARHLFAEEFEPVFHLGAAPQEVAPGCLVHRAYPTDWLIARKPKVGQPKLLASHPSRPSEVEYANAFESEKTGELERGVEGLLSNVADFFS